MKSTTCELSSVAVAGVAAKPAAGKIPVAQPWLNGPLSSFTLTVGPAVKTGASLVGVSVILNVLACERLTFGATFEPLSTATTVMPVLPTASLAGLKLSVPVELTVGWISNRAGLSGVTTKVTTCEACSSTDDGEPASMLVAQLLTVTTRYLEHRLVGTLGERWWIVDFSQDDRNGTRTTAIGVPLSETTYKKVSIPTAFGAGVLSHRGDDTCREDRRDSSPSAVVRSTCVIVNAWPASSGVGPGTSPCNTAEDWMVICRSSVLLSENTFGIGASFTGLTVIENVFSVEVLLFGAGEARRNHAARHARSNRC